MYHLTIIILLLTDQQHIIKSIDNTFYLIAFAGELAEVLSACSTGDYLAEFLV